MYGQVKIVYVSSLDSFESFDFASYTALCTRCRSSSSRLLIVVRCTYGANCSTTNMQFMAGVHVCVCDWRCRDTSAFLTSSHVSMKQRVRLYFPYISHMRIARAQNVSLHFACSHRAAHDGIAPKPQQPTYRHELTSQWVRSNTNTHINSRPMKLINDTHIYTTSGHHYTRTCCVIISFAILFFFFFHFAIFVHVQRKQRFVVSCFHRCVVYMRWRWHRSVWNQTSCWFVLLLRQTCVRWKISQNIFSVVFIENSSDVTACAAILCNLCNTSALHICGNN